MKQLLNQYFSILDQYAQERERELYNPNTLLRHFSSEGLNALWCQDEAHGASIPQIVRESSEPDGTEESGQVLDFRKREPFQQIISTFALDVTHEARARERSRQQYTIPGELEASFHPEKLQLVVDRFQLFGVFNRGTLPRQEILPFLAGLVKKLEITDMYEIITVLLSGEQFSRYEAPTANASGVHHQPIHLEISLVQILAAIHVCRRSRSASSYASGAGAYSTASRKANNFVSHKPTRGSNGGTHDVDPSSSESNDDNVVGVLPLDPISSSKDLPLSTKHNRRSKAHGLFVQQQPISSKSNPSSKTSASRAHGNYAGTGKKGKRSSATSSLCHETSVVFKEDESEVAVAAAQAHPGMLSRHASKKNSEPRLPLGNLLSGNNTTGNLDRGASQTGDSSFQELNSSASLLRQSGSIRKFPTAIPFAAPIPNSDAEGTACRELNTSASPSKAPPSHVQNSTAFRVFMLLGGEHDGAICYIAELALPSRRLEESKGIFYRHAPHEMRLSEGFVLHPPNQLQRIDDMLSEIRQRNPHYASVLPGNNGEPSSFGSLDNRNHKVDSPTILRRSLDRSGTCVRQSSISRANPRRHFASEAHTRCGCCAPLAGCGSRSGTVSLSSADRSRAVATSRGRLYHARCWTCSGTDHDVGCLQLPLKDVPLDAMAPVGGTWHLGIVRAALWSGSRLSVHIGCLGKPSAVQLEYRRGVH
ncbi:hypothetical protein FI667_g7805, partial [Globisporangium splendens]